MKHVVMIGNEFLYSLELSSLYILPPSLFLFVSLGLLINKFV